MVNLKKDNNKVYIVEVTEYLQKQIEVKANSREEAFEIAKQKYKNDEIELDCSNLTQVDFDIQG